jgi:methionine sulfoxide reductase heme-binding subunit
MNSLLWYLGRSTGIVAMVLAAASLILGLLFSGRETGTRLKPNWWLDLHNWLGGLAVAFTGLHMLTLFADSDAGVSFASLFIPGQAKADSLSITLGVLAMYGMAVPSVTGLARIRRRMPRSFWHIIHLISVPAVLLGGIHGFLSGSDRDTLLYKGLMVLLIGATAYPAALRILGIQARKRAAGVA